MFTQEFDYLYIEPSSYCALKCPRCPRTTDPGTYTLTHLDPELIYQTLEWSGWAESMTVEYGGNYGDPIYSPRLIDMVTQVKILKPLCRQMIHTNGSRRSKDWWNKLISRLDAKDTIIFSIDGLEETNHLYRKNSDWTSIIQALESSVNKVEIIWKFIVFSFNQHQIRETIEFARNIGVNSFLLTKSHLFYGGFSVAGKDELAPDRDWIATSSTTSTKPGIEPKCKKTARHYISASGFYFPCCWIANEYENSKFEVYYGQDLKKLNFEGALKSGALAQLAQSWNSNPNSICRNKCAKSCEKKERSHHQQLYINLQQDESAIWHQLNNFKQSDLAY